MSFPPYSVDVALAYARHNTIAMRATLASGDLATLRHDIAATLTSMAGAGFAGAGDVPTPPLIALIQAYVAQPTLLDSLSETDARALQALAYQLAEALIQIVAAHQRDARSSHGATVLHGSHADEPTLDNEEPRHE